MLQHLPPQPVDEGLRRSAIRLMAALQELATLRDPAEVLCALADAAGCLDTRRQAWAADLTDVLYATELQARRVGVRDHVYREARELLGLATLLRRGGDPVLRAAVVHAFAEFTARVRLRAEWVRRHRVGVSPVSRRKARISEASEA
jgi:hypothetical protein